MSLRVVSHGCKANQADGAALEAALRDVPGDLVVINSCTVTHAADADARKAIRAASREHPGAQVVVTGCAASVSPARFAAMPEVHRVLTNVDKPRARELLAQGAVGPPGPDGPLPPVGGLAEGFRLGTRPYLKVQDGCDYACSFCIIPTARGASRSRPAEALVAELQALEAAGAEEVVLTGIHLGHWGRELRPRRRLAHLVEVLLEHTRGLRLRISSVEPNEVDDQLVELVTQHPRVCRHLHLPLQSGDDRVLALMRRVYRVAGYARVVEALRARAPSLCLGADVLVGFPGETAAELDRTRALVERLGLSYLHVFPYSAREGTAATRLPGRVTSGELRRRVTALSASSAALRQRFEAQSVGRVEHVLVERRRQGGLLFGRSSRYVGVRFEGNDELVGRVLAVQVTSQNKSGLLGHLVGPGSSPGGSTA